MDDIFFSLVGLACTGVTFLLPITAIVMVVQSNARLKRLEVRYEDILTDHANLQRQLGELRVRLASTPARIAAPAPAPASAPEVVAAPAPAPEVATPAEEPISKGPPPVVLRGPMPAPAPAGEPAPEPKPKPIPAAAARQRDDVDDRDAPRPDPFAAWTFERVAVWLAAAGGGSALVLAGLYFFALAVQEGWVSPAARYALGLAVGMGLVTGAELLWSRRYQIPAAGLTGAGIGVLYGALYAGTELYDLLPHAATFGLMMLVTAVSTLLANRHRSLFLAMLGGLGGFMTPILLSTGENRAVALFVYLGVLNAGLLVTAVRQGWLSLVMMSTLLTLGIQLGWGIEYLEQGQIFVALVAALGLGGMYALASTRTEADTSLSVSLLSAGALLMIGGSVIFLAPLGEVGTDPYVSLRALWLLGAAALLHGCGAARERIVAGALLAGAVGLAQLVYVGGWADLAAPPRLWLLVVVFGPALVAWGASLWSRDSTAALVSYGVSLICGGVWLLVDETTAADGSLVRWPLVAVVAGSLLLVLPLVFWSPRAATADDDEAPAPPTAAPLLELPPVGSWAMAAGLLSVALSLSGLCWMWADAGAGGSMLLLALFAWAVVSVTPFGLASLGRPVSEGLWACSALAGPVLFLPMYVGWTEGLGESLIGVLAVGLGLAALGGVVWHVRAGASPDSRILALFAGVALLFAAGVVPLQLEEEWLTIGWALEIAALAWLSRRLTHGIVPAMAGILAVLVGVRLLLNPAALEYHAIAGPVLLNWILYTWGVPAAAFLFAARVWKPTRPGLAAGLLLGGVAILFALTNLQVAHAFAQDGMLSFSSDDLVEEMTRSVSWAAFGVALLLAGLAGSNRMLRVLAFLFLLLAAFKVFLIDLWSLSGLARVGSILGLGMFLLVAALLFQRVVLRMEEEEGRDRKRNPDPDPDPDADPRAGDAT